MTGMAHRIAEGSLLRGVDATSHSIGGRNGSQAGHRCRPVTVSHPRLLLVTNEKPAASIDASIAFITTAAQKKGQAARLPETGLSACQVSQEAKRT